MSNANKPKAIDSHFEEMMNDPRLEEMMQELRDGKIKLPELISAEEFERMTRELENDTSEDGLTPLERCQRAFFALTVAERALFIHWMTTLRM